MTHNTTIVIGIGEAGTKIASDLYDDLDEIYGDEEEDFRDYFSFVGIDTRGEDLNAFANRDFVQIELEPHSGLFNEVRDLRPYLTDQHEFEQAGGATRQRGVSRFYMDNSMNYSDFREELKSALNTAIENSEAPGEVDVWLVNSLGGGTGSGAFPFVAALIRSMEVELEENVRLNGIGSLPRVENLEERDIKPEGNPMLYANTYAALRELSALVGYEFDNHDIEEREGFRYTDAAGADYPVSIPVYAADASPVSELNEPPFDFYAVMGIDEDTSGDTLRNLNRIAGNIILFFSGLRGREDFAENFGRMGEDPILWSVTGGEAEAPVNEIEPYLELEEELEELEEELADQRLYINRHRVNRDILKELIEFSIADSPDAEIPLNTSVYDPDNGERTHLQTFLDETAQEEGDEFDEQDSSLRQEVGLNVYSAWDNTTDAYSQAESAADAFNMEYSKEILEDQVKRTLLDGAISFTSDLLIDNEALHKYFYYQILLKRYRENRAEHDFPDKIENQWNSHVDEIRKKRSKIDNLDVSLAEFEELNATDESDYELAIERWETVLRPYREYRVTQAEDALDNTRFFELNKKKRLKRELQSREKEKKELTFSYGEFETIHQAVNDLETRRGQVRSELEEQKRKLDSELRDDIVPDYEKMDEEKQNKQGTLQSKRENLSEPGEGRFPYLKLQNFTEFTPELLEDYDSISELVEQHVVDKRHLINTINQMEDEELIEPIEDREDWLIPHGKDTYAGGLGREEDAKVSQGGISVQNSSVSLGDNKEEYHDIPDRFRLRLLRMFYPVRLENTSEFGKIHELYEDEFSSVSDEFERNMSDDKFITNSFAYPELFPEDEKIVEQFGLGDQLSRQAEDD